MRPQAENDIRVEVEGVGEFRYARRTLGDSLKIRAEFIRLLGGLPPDADDDLAGMANIFATHRVLCTGCPAGWEDFGAIDEASHPHAVATVLEVFFKLKESEDSFRGGKDGAGKA